MCRLLCAITVLVVVGHALLTVHDAPQSREHRLVDCCPQDPIPDRVLPRPLGNVLDVGASGLSRSLNVHGQL